MLSRALTWRDDMTVEQMTASFGKLQKALIKHVRNKYRIEQDPEDIVYSAYLSALNGKEYEKVLPEMARSWWYYKVSAKASVHIKEAVKEAAAFRQYQLDPTKGETEHEDLSVSEGLEVLEEYWEGLPAYQRSRLRQRWLDEGREWLPFMEPKC
jgi:DNA-directed RNA polymerase specialized sigma24 family protein